MRILIVANYNTGHFSPFVVEQVDSIRKLGVEFEYFGVVGKGPLGYLKNLSALKRKIKEFKPDIVHAQYGLSGLLATLQKKVPVIVTFHGSDIHKGGLILFLSRIAMYKAVWNIIVSNPLCKIANIKRNVSVIPCGADEKMFVPMNKEVVRAKLGWGKSEKVVAFAGAFDREVKNPQLAKDAMHGIPDARLLELKGYSRKEVNFIFNAVDCLLMTSHNEGSPQVIKEAMLCGTPIVSVDVGDVKDVCGSTEGTYICKATPQDIADSLNKAFIFGKRTDGRERIIQLGLTNELVAKQVFSVYSNVLANRIL